MLLPGALPPGLGMQREQGRGGKPLPALLPEQAVRGQESKGNALALSPRIPRRRPCQHPATLATPDGQAAPSHFIPLPAVLPVTVGQAGAQSP